MGASTTTRPTHQARVSSTGCSVGPPSTSARTALTVIVTGWWAAKTWSQPGIDVSGTNAEDANTSGASSGKAAAWALSGSPVARPMLANSHERAKPNSSSRKMAAKKATTFVWTWKPTAKPTTHIRATTMTLRTTSADVRPARTAE